MGVRPEWMVAADLDNNGSPDLAVTNRDSNDTWTFLSNADNGGGGGDQPCNGADLAAPFGVLDLADIQAFIVEFTGGCP